MKIIIHSQCPLCQSEKIFRWMQTKDFMVTREEFELWKCERCGFVFTQNIPDPEEISRYYQSQDYISHSDTRKGLMNRLYHFSRIFMLRMKWRMVKRLVKQGRLLDIGCGTGYFPGFMNKKGFKAVGVEVDPNARFFAEKEFGLEVFSPKEFEEKKIEGKFEVITLWHVLEHVHDFNLYFKRMKEYLIQGGHLLIAVPNCNAYDARHYKEFWAGYDVPRHLWHFTPSTIKIIAEDQGFRLLKMKRLPLDPFYNAMLSEKYKGNRWFMISGIFFGKLAMLESWFNRKKSSSVVYFLKGLETPNQTN